MTWWQRLAAMFRKRTLDQDLDAELASHVQMATDDFMAQGLSEAEARRRALVQLGGVEPAKDLHRDARGWPALDALWQDLRYAWRSLRRDWGFALFATLIVGLGVGASAAVFSIVNTVLVKPLPFREPERLVWMANRTKDADNMSARTLQVGPVVKLQERNQSFAQIAAFFAFYSPGDHRLTGDGEPERVTAVPVSEHLFPLLGVQPALGRQFTAEECKWNAAPVAMLTYGFWQRRFGGDPAILQRPLRLDGRQVTITGVMPESFDFASIFAPGVRVDMFVPFPLTPETDRWGNTLSVVGRLKPGVAVGQAQAELDALSPRINSEDLRANRISPQLTLLNEYVGRQMRSALFLLAAAVGVVMLIVCANLSHLMLARTSARQREMAIRTALGAGAGRLVRQMLAESLLLTGMGAAVAVALAFALVRGLAQMNAFHLPLLSTIEVDLRVMGFALVLATATGVLLGLASALRAAGLRNLNASLSRRGANQGGSADGNWLSAGLVVAEVAFAAVLLVGTGLLLRSFLEVLDVQLGFRPENAASLRAEYTGPQPPARTTDTAARIAWLDDALGRVRSINGVTAVAMADVLPLGRNRTWGAGEKGKTYPPGQYPLAFVRLVTDGYLRSLGIRLKAGRDLTPQDVFDSAPVMLVNESLARTLAPNGGSAIGKLIANSCGKDREIVGVVEDVRHLALEAGSGNEMYLPMRQCRDSMATGELVVRSALPLATLAPQVDAALRPIAPELPKATLQPLELLVDRAASPRRFVVMVLVGFAGFALLLASLGIYGLISYSVTQRTSEIGIRMALGESPFGVQQRILRQTLVLAGVGVVAGAVASMVLAGSLRSLLYGVSPLDPWAFGGAAALLLAIAALAGFLPAQAASRVDPIICLRAD